MVKSAIISLLVLALTVSDSVAACDPASLDMAGRQPVNGSVDDGLYNFEWSTMVEDQGHFDLAQHLVKVYPGSADLSFEWKKAGFPFLITRGVPAGTIRCKYDYAPSETMIPDFDAPIYYGLNRTRQSAVVYANIDLAGYNISYHLPSEKFELLSDTQLFMKGKYLSNETTDNKYSGIKMLSLSKNSLDDPTALLSGRWSPKKGLIEFYPPLSVFSDTTRYQAGYETSYRTNSGEIRNVVVKIESSFSPTAGRSILIFSYSPGSVNVGVSIGSTGHPLPYGLPAKGKLLEAKGGQKEDEFIGMSGVAFAKHEGTLPLIGAVKWRGNDLSYVQAQDHSPRYYFLGEDTKYGLEDYGVREMVIAPVSVVILDEKYELLDIVVLNIALPLFRVKEIYGANR